ncbi:MAG: phosphatase PAP2 family protein [Flavobacteriales bacterium]|nr:phosphatase PAP2 family protein [Flavobacteriales bacterium]
MAYLLDTILDFDEKLLLIVNGWSGSSWLDGIMILVSSKWTWIPFYIILLFMLYRKLGLPSLFWLLLAVAVMIVLTDQGSVVLFKDMFHRLRPCHNQLLLEKLNVVSGNCGGKYGFVSSHAANVFGLAILLKVVLNQNKKLMIALLFWASLIAFSRVYLGVHYPLDVFVGGVFGSLVGYLNFRLVRPVLNL